MDLISKDDFRKKLKIRFAEMVEKNSNYSLRALAKKTELSPSVLSRVINGKRNLSLETMLKISQALDFELVGLTHDQDRVDHKRISVLEAETFKVLADWYHFPLLELVRTKGFKSDERWIAKRLGVPQALIQTALDRLENLGFITRVDGEIRLSPEREGLIKTTDDKSSLAIRKHHKQMLEKATEALEEPVRNREFRALNLNFDPSEMDEAKKMIREFYKRFNKRFQKKSGDEVYQINLQLFKLTKECK